ncbi:hypothetical protein D9M68_607410 [compost metagenome]
MHGELDLADAAARELHVVGAPGVAGGALGRVLADLAVQRAQRVEDVVVQVLAEHKGQHRAAQGAGALVGDAGGRGDHAAFEPGEAFPLAALHLEILFQRAQRNRARPRVAVGPQRQVDAEHVAVFGGFAHGVVDVLDRLAEVLVVADAVAALGIAGGLAVVVVHVDQVDVARHVELARAELAHADHPELSPLARLGQRRAIQPVQLGEGQGAGGVEREFGQFGDRAGHHLERGVLLAVEHHQALQHQLAQHAQGRGHGQTALQQLRQAGLHAGVDRGTRWQAVQLAGIAPAHALREAGIGGRAVGLRQGIHAGCDRWHIC